MSEAAVPSSGPINANAVGAVIILAVLGITIVPLPPAALDVLLALSISISVLVFMVALYVERPLEFSAFPSLLLLVTLFRLALNIATTRSILLHGGEGPEAVGHVVKTFGEFAVGGNYVVGAVVFLILIVVNFIVITKGAERISEVSARFTLDSMPGKQMAIDADLGAGLINEHEARARRKRIEAEADFHGAMDGASKFVRGDAIAGLIITAINIVGGFVVGIAFHGLSLKDSAATFTLLSIGDGLVSQLPALLVSTGAALLTRRRGHRRLRRIVGDQLFSNYRPLTIWEPRWRQRCSRACRTSLFTWPPPSFPLAWRNESGRDQASAAKQAEPKANDPAAQRPRSRRCRSSCSPWRWAQILPMVDAAKNGEPSPESPRSVSRWRSSPAWWSRPSMCATTPPAAGRIKI
jgi:flagellar biosynthesis component FlhA